MFHFLLILKGILTFPLTHFMKNTLLLIITLLCIQQLHAQNSPSFQFKFDHVALSVKDVNRSAEFYMNILHLNEITNRSKIEGIRWFAVGEGKELHLISVIKEPVTTNKAIHLGLMTNNFEALVAHLDASKIPYSDWPGLPHTITTRADGIKQLYFQDPDGYWIEVNNVK